MPGWRGSILLSLACLIILLGWALDAAAHRRGGLPLARPGPPPSAQPPAPVLEKASGPLALTPEAYWQRFQAQAKGGELAAARETGLALVNLFPETPQGEAALFKLAEQAITQGEHTQALMLYGLVAALRPGTPEAARARMAAGAMELSRDLNRDDPVQALRRFLEKVATLTPGNQPEILKEALKTGWQAVAHQVRATPSPPLPLVEEVLALWDLQPQGAGPVEAALLLADLLKERGLLEEAQVLLSKVGQQTTGLWESKLQSHSLELAWLSRGWAGLTDALPQGHSKVAEQKSLLRGWLARRESGGQSLPAPLPKEDFLTWFLPQAARAAGPEGQDPVWEQALRHSWPAPLASHLQAEMARRSWAQGDFSRVARMHQMMAEPSVSGNLTPFYQDRLGLSRLRDGQVDAAQAAFQVLSQHDDPFWQRLAQVRMGDLELVRLQAEPSP